MQELISKEKFQLGEVTRKKTINIYHGAGGWGRGGGLVGGIDLTLAV